MILRNYIRIICVTSLCCCLPAAFAQETCTEENQEVLDSCIADARASCEASVPECEPTTITPEATLLLLAERCGSCEEAQKFGKFNSCLKKVRNGIRRLGALSDEIRETLSTARTECKEEKQAGKGNGNQDDDESDDDDSEQE